MQEYFRFSAKQAEGNILLYILPLTCYNILNKGGVLMEISDGMDITAYAMMNSQIQIQQGVNTQVLKKTMDLQEAQGSQLVQMMEQSVNPGLGQNIDIRI